MLYRLALLIGYPGYVIVAVFKVGEGFHNGCKSNTAKEEVPLPFPESTELRGSRFFKF